MKWFTRTRLWLSVQVIDYLRHVPTFSKFSDEKLEKMFENLDLQEWAAGETVFRKGEVRCSIAEAAVRRGKL